VIRERALGLAAVSSGCGTQPQEMNPGYSLKPGPWLPDQEPEGRLGRRKHSRPCVISQPARPVTLRRPPVFPTPTAQARRKAVSLEDASNA